MTTIVDLPLLPDFTSSVVLQWDTTPEETLKKVVRVTMGVVYEDPYETYSKNLEGFLYGRIMSDIRGILPILDSLPQNAKILTIGSGMGVLEQYISVLYPTIQFYLVDRTGWDITDAQIGEGPLFNATGNIFTNDTSIFADSADGSAMINASRFTYMDPDTEWPTDIDFIFSIRACGWRFPLSYYSDRVAAALKSGGKFYAQVVNNNNYDIPSVETALNSTTTKSPIPVNEYFFNRNDVQKIDNTIGNYCTWTKTVV